MKIKSNFAILDVKKGRKKLVRHFDECPKRPRIPILIEGYIDGQHSEDDGTSIEFSVEVTSVRAGFIPEGAAVDFVAVDFVGGK